ncbi:hypothetical protein [Ferruginibacter sp.]
MDANEILDEGLKHLESWLLENGYSDIVIDKFGTDVADIHAKGLTENIIVEVKTALYPDEKTASSRTYKFALKELATKLEKIAYVAYLVIDKDKNLIGEIIWERLN